jgi:hypothetical protein
VYGHAHKTDIDIFRTTAFNPGPDCVLIVTIDFFHQVTQVTHAPERIHNIAVMYAYSKGVSMSD